MKNITLSIDDETYRQARIHAAERGTTVSALVRNYLNALSRRGALAADPTTALFDTLDRADSYQASSRMTREESHARGRVR
jgi:antitoxin component of RelBE/YafQ-DinJ toxin-antitoxin module